MINFFYLSLNSDTVPSLQFQLNFHTSSHWATWYTGEKVSNFSAWFSLALLLSDHKVPNGRGTGRARETRVSLYFSHFSFCKVGRRLLTQAISQPKFHEQQS